MRTICEDAAQVIVWLGRSLEPQDELLTAKGFGAYPGWNAKGLNKGLQDTPLVFTLVEGLGTMYKKYFSNGVSTKPFSEIQSENTVLKCIFDGNLTQTVLEQRFWLERGRLLWRPWFGRVWVFQEYLIASKTTVVCGNYDVAGRKVEQFLKLLLQGFGSLSGIPPFLTMAGIQRAIVMMLKTDFSSMEMKPHDELLSWLLHTSHLLATDPRDKIYRVMGPQGARALKPDYSKPEAEIYREAAKFVLEKSQHLDVLCARNASRMGDLVSWAPDWTMADDALQYHPPQLESIYSFLKFQTFLHMSHVQKVDSVWGSGSDLPWGSNFRRFMRLSTMSDRVRRPYTVRFGPKFKDAVTPVHTCLAIMHVAAGAEFSPDGNVLILLGFVVDRITRIGPCQRFDLAAAESASFLIVARNEVFDSWEEIFFGSTRETNIYQSEQDRTQAFGILMIAYDPKMSESINRDGLIKETAVSMWQSVRKRPFPPLGPDDTVQRNMFKMYLYRMKSMTSGCQIFVTEKGYIGLIVTSHKVDVGDEVCLLRGAKRPLILRKAAGECYTLMGRCYVQGLMRGEAWQQWVAAKDPLTAFKLI